MNNFIKGSAVLALAAALCVVVCPHKAYCVEDYQGAQGVVHPSDPASVQKFINDTNEFNQFLNARNAAIGTGRKVMSPEEYAAYNAGKTAASTVNTQAALLAQQQQAALAAQNAQQKALLAAQTAQQQKMDKLTKLATEYQSYVAKGLQDSSNAKKVFAEWQKLMGIQ